MSTDPGDELVDVIGSDGRTIATVPRREMRKKRLRHRCTYILVFDHAGRLFVHQRTATKDVYPSHWDVTVGGVLAAGESFEAGAVRELREELGIAAELERLFPFQYADNASIAGAMVYRVCHDGPFRLQPEEIVHGRFVERSELPSLLSERPFCPDGVAVWMEYQRRYPGSSQEVE